MHNTLLFQLNRQRVIDHIPHSWTYNYSSNLQTINFFKKRGKTVLTIIYKSVVSVKIPIHEDLIKIDVTGNYVINTKSMY